MFGYSLLFQDYVNNLLKQYKQFKDHWLTTAIGFAGVASENSVVFTPPVDADFMIFGFNVDFSNAGVLVTMVDTSTGYNFMTLQSTGTTSLVGTPITAVAGLTTQVMPVLSLICPFWLSRQSKIQYNFRNSASAQTTGGNISAVGIKLFS